MKKTNKKSLVNGLSIGALVISCLSFTSLVIPSGEYQPKFLALPYTLWAGLIVTILFVVLTYTVSRIHPGNEEDEL